MAEPQTEKIRKAVSRTAGNLGELAARLAGPRPIPARSR